MPAEEARTARRMKPWNMSILALRTITVLPGVSTSICSVPRVYVCMYVNEPVVEVEVMQDCHLALVERESKAAAPDVPLRAVKMMVPV